MLVNSNYRYSGGSAGSSSFIEGYYNDSKFYQDDSFSTEIEGESGKLYVDISTNKAYRWTGSIFTAFNSDNAEFAANADSVNSLRTDVDSYISDIFSTILSPSHLCWNKKYSVYGQSSDTNADLYLDNAPEISNAVWYEVETIGNGGRAYQIAHGCYSHQQKSFIRYMHDGVWSGWKNLADGGNADTLDGLHANGFVKVNTHSAYDCNTLYDTGIYLCGEGTTNGPNSIQYGSLLVMTYRKPYGNACPDYCAQIFIPNGDDSDTSMWYRTSLQNTWNEWKRSCDGGNADTVDGKHASSFIQWIGQQADTTIISDPNYKIDYHCGIDNGAMIGLPVSAWYHIIYYQHLNPDGYGMQIAYPLNHAGDIMTRRSNGFTWTEWKAILTSSGGTMTGALVAQSNTAYSTPQVRNVTMSTSAPSGGSNGQIHFQYS